MTPAALLALFAFQVAGEILVRVAGIPVPGPVAGMLLLLGALTIRGGAPRPLTETALGLLRHLSLLFVPAGVGIMAFAGMLVAEWPAVALTMVSTTIVTIAATARVLSALSRVAEGPAATLRRRRTRVAGEGSGA